MFILFRYIFFLFSLSFLHSMEEVASHAPTPPVVSKISEGWVLHGGLNFALGLFNLDCTPIHRDMASSVNNSFCLQRGSAGDEEGQRCTAVVRFQFVYGPEDSDTCYLSVEGAAPETPNKEELVFISGKMPAPGPKGGYGGRDLVSNIRRPLGSVFIQYVFPTVSSIGLKKSLVCKRDGLPSEAVCEDIQRRWQPGGNSFLQPCLAKLRASHEETYRCLMALPNLVEKKHRFEELKKEAGAEKGARAEIVDILLKEPDELVRAECAAASYRKKQEACDACIKKIDELPKYIDSLFKNPEANNYTCAEQTMIAFLEDCQIAGSVQTLSRAGVAPSYIIVHVCSYFVPCHHCATSWVRECEPGGVISRIFGDIPVRLVASCLQPYERNAKKIGYDSVNFSPASDDAFTSSHNLINQFPYPLVLLGENFEPRQDLQSVLDCFSPPQEIKVVKKGKKAP